MKHSPLRFRILAALSLIVPLPLFAAPTTFRDIAALFVRAINGFATIIFSSLVIGMIYGVILYIVNADNEKTRTEIKGYLMWGIIGIAVLLSLWGIINILSYTLGWGDTGIVFISPPV